MIIEFTGIPGSGKSTVFASLEKVIKSDKYIFDIKKYILGFNGNTIVYDIFLVLNFFKLEFKGFCFLKDIVRIVFKSNNSLFHKMNIIRNSYKKLILYQLLHNKQEVFFIDEGVSHILFTLFVDVGKEINASEVEMILVHMPNIDRILIIDAPDDELFKRVVNRGGKGHNRINFDKTEDIVCFMKQSREVLELIKEYFDGHLYNNIEIEINLEKILIMLGFKDV